MDASTAARIQALKTVSGWDDLTQILEATVEKRRERLIAGLDRGDALDQRQIDFERGVTHGIRVLLNAPDKAGSIYDRLTNEEAPFAE
jgi:ABC-type Na+ transport system ATPase subunit NatA